MARPLTPYGRRRVDVLGSVPAASNPPTYYGRPALKPTDWRWLIVSYLFAGGLAGAAQVIAGAVDAVGHRRDRGLVAAARYTALLGALVSPALLIADLKTPSRWYNMLRIYRGTSPMSIGAWGLFAFGGLSFVAAAAQVLADAFHVRAARTVARVVGIPAAIAGALVATYTGSLLSATSTPLWSTAYKLLPPVFGLSGAATATAALSLVLQRIGASRGSRRRLERLAMLTSALELLLTLRLDSEWKRQGVAGPLEQPPLMLPYRVGVLGCGILAPLGVHVLQTLSGRELHRLAIFGSLAALAGGYTQRAVLVFAGKRSAAEPRDYFRIAQ